MQHNEGALMPVETMHFAYVHTWMISPLNCRVHLFHNKYQSEKYEKHSKVVVVVMVVMILT